MPQESHDHLLTVIDELRAEVARLTRRIQLMRSEREADADHFATALASRDEIGQAKGIIMATTGCDADAAFELLKQQSQQENRKLVEIARDIAARRAPTSPADL